MSVRTNAVVVAVLQNNNKNMRHRVLVMHSSFSGRVMQTSHAAIRSVPIRGPTRHPLGCVAVTGRFTVSGVHTTQLGERASFFVRAIVLGKLIFPIC